MNVNIVILGVNHNDPLGRNKLIMKLKELKNNGFIPHCIATEWDKHIAQSIISQREGFTYYAKEKAPYLYKETLEALAYAMAYEADSHISLYPNLPIVWLDEGSKYYTSIDYYPKDRFDIYLDAINKLNDEEKNNLALISKNIWSVSYSGNATERDIRFYYKILNAIESGYRKILIIVGASHANIDINNSLVDRLIKNNFSVEAIILDYLLST